MAEEEKSEIQKALEERAKNRPVQVVEGLAFTGPGHKVIGSIALRVATKQEENAAIAQAEVYLKGLASQADGAVDVKDPDLANAARTVYILHAVCRDPKSPNTAFAFTSGKEMMRLLTCDEVGKLLDLYNRFRAAQSPFDRALTVEDVEAEAARLAAVGTTEVADMLVQSKDRIWLEQFAVRLSMLFANRQQELAIYRAMDPVDTEAAIAG